MNKFKSIIYFLIKGEFKFILNGISKRINSEIIAIGFKRDLNNNFQAPKSKIKIKTRLSQKSDDPYFINDNHNYGLVQKNIKNCYVATNANDLPFFRVWLMESSENKKIQSFFTGNYPNLNKNEILAEGAFTIPSYRGNQILPAAISEILEKGNIIGVSYILAFIDVNNIPSLRSYKRAGFYPYILRREKWFFFIKRVSFMDIPKDILEKYYSDTASV